MERIRAVLCTSCCVVLAMVLVGCTKSITSYHRQGFQSTAVKKILVTDPVDGRWVVAEKHDYAERAKELHEHLVDALKSHGCDVVTSPGAHAKWTSAQVAFADETMIRGMASQSVQWVMVPVIEDDDGQLVLYLFDANAGKLVWEGTCNGDGLSSAAGTLLSRYRDLQ